MANIDIMRERDYRLKVIAAWESKHYPLSKDYKYDILSNQTLESINLKLAELSEWQEFDGIAKYGGE